MFEFFLQDTSIPLELILGMHAIESAVSDKLMSWNENDTYYEVMTALPQFDLQKIHITVNNPHTSSMRYL